MTRLLLTCLLLLPSGALGQTLEAAKEAYKKANYIEATEAFEAIFARDGDSDALFMAGAARFAAGHMAHSIRHVEKWLALGETNRRVALDGRAKSLLEQAQKATFAVKIILPADVARDRKLAPTVRFNRNLGETQVPSLEWTAPVGWDAAPLEVRLDKGDWVAEVELKGYRPSPQLQVIEEDSVVMLAPEIAASLLGKDVHIAVRLGFQEAIDLFRGKRFAEAVESCEALLSQAPGVEEIEWLKARALHLAGQKGHAYGAYLRFLTLYPEATDAPAVKAALEALKPAADAEIATITFASNPPGGAVTLLDQKGVSGQTPVVAQLYPGRYTLTVTLEGHEPVRKVFDVAPRETQTITADLVRPEVPVSWRYGGALGLGIGSPGGFEHPSITATGGARAAVGGFVEHRLTDALSLRGELRYAFDQMTIDDEEQGESVTWTRHSLAVPLLAQLAVAERLVVMGGASLDLVLAGTQTDEDDNSTDVGFAATVLGGVVGVGYIVKDGDNPLRLDLRVERTATSLLDAGDQGLVLGHLRTTLDVGWAF